MTHHAASDAERRPPSPVVQQLISMFAAAVLMTAIAVVAIAVTGGLPPRLGLTGITWQWTGSTAGRGEIPLVVPDPAAYTIRFDRDRTLVAVADCAEVAGAYSVLTAGRAGGAVNGLTMEVDSLAGASCGAESLAATFVEQLGSSSRYVIDGNELTITLVSRDAMVFEAVVPAARPTPGG